MEINNERGSQPLPDPEMKFNLYRAWPIILALIVFTIWLVRLEAKVQNNEDFFDKYRAEKQDETKEVNGKLDKLITAINDARVGIANIEGRLGVERK